MDHTWRQDGDDLLLSVRLTPGARRQGVGGRWRDAHGTVWLTSSVRAVPEKGRANIALIALMAAALGIPKSTILLESGDSNRLKRLRISGGGHPAALDRITALLDQQAGPA